MAYLLRLIPSAYVATLWNEFEDSQSKWFETICDVPRSEPPDARLAYRVH